LFEGPEAYNRVVDRIQAVVAKHRMRAEVRDMFAVPAPPPTEGDALEVEGEKNSPKKEDPNEKDEEATKEIAGGE
jgi:hypothetical protein